MVPFSVEEMWESSASNMNEFMEDSWNDGLSINLKVKACLLSQSKKLLEHESSRLFKDWVDARVKETGMTLSVLLGDQDLVLDMEVRDVVLQVDVFGDDEDTDDLPHNFGNKTIVC